jgi:hypothetical protein
MLPPNPYAFPVGGDPEEPGMELRDYFAGQALVGLITQTIIAEAAQAAMKSAEMHDISVHDVIARSAYTYADAMLAAREWIHARKAARDAVS